MAPDGMQSFNIPSLRGKVSDDEWNARVDLACTYRLVAYYGWTHVTANHISLRVPGEEDHFLLNPFGLLFDEVTASSLVKIDLDGSKVMESEFGINQAGYVIHSAIHGARRDVTCAIHTHTEAGMAVSAQKDGLLPLNMSAIRFYDRIAYHDYEGVTIDVEERENIVKHLGNHFAMILRNHGLLTCGSTIAEAFMLMYYLDRACKNQLDTYSTGLKLKVPSDNIMEYAAVQFDDPRFHLGKHEWPALIRLLEKNKSIYNQ